MKISIHAIYYHPEVGGMESHIKDLAEEFVRRGHRVNIVCGRSLPGLSEQEVIDGVEVYRTRWFGRNAVGWFRYVVGSLATFDRVAADADIVHAQGFPCALATRRVAGRRHISNLVTVHSSHFLRLARKRLLHPGFRYLFGPTDHILTPSAELQAAVESVLPGRRAECYVNSVNTRRFRRVEPSLACPGKTVIVCPRRLVEKNGVRYAILALPLIKREMPVHLYMAGPGPLQPELERLAGELGVAEDVTFLGAVAHDRMPAVLSSADVILVPSLMEATSIAALESMACERVIAASRVGGLPEIIDEEIGALFEPANPEAIAAAVRELLRRDRAAMGQTARRRVEENWSATRLADHHLALYQRLIRSKSPGTTGRDA
ncbi:MAG TPA: glycosyltransferase family 1 protein [candidate division WOR-3 bacterium]|uniref:Glycosyltransferase family 1 protein n=1 Tax=candidate division WOR-3 bacterium TaxID=2052148 RepID=A0A7V0T5A5_UNCW3|nr:glycosyltransferase family 1 protein [candidate division WOR-3 bacterium]